MKKRNKNSPADSYSIGYCKPPKHSRFQKGKSGNPGGRPKKLKGLNELLGEELQKMMQIGGKSMPLQTVFIQSIIRNAIQGKQAAMNYVISYLASHDEKNDEEEFDPDIDDMIALKRWACMAGVDTSNIPNNTSTAPGS